MPALIPLILLALVLGLLVWEAMWVKSRVRRIPLRIHVVGTRGKSSVTRFIAAGLRTSGRRTVAKITGVIPTVIDTEGRDVPIHRRSEPRVVEQFRIIGRAAASKAEALVLECMSITPELQELECRHYRPTLCVVTTIGDDHQEQLGDDYQQQVDAVRSAIPENSTVLTFESPQLPAIREMAQQRHCALLVADMNLGEISLGILPVNVALAVEACAFAGVPPIQSMPAIIEEARRVRDEIFDIEPGSKFVNGFAINDVTTAGNFVQYWRSAFPQTTGTVVMLNTRQDRPLRTRTFARWLAQLPERTAVILTGTHVPYARRRLAAAGVPPEQIVYWNQRDLPGVRRKLELLAGQNALIVGLGNIAGDGHKVLAALRRHQHE